MSSANNNNTPTPEKSTSLDHSQEIIEQLRLTRPNAWDQYPDIDLYMDQLLAYVNKQVPFSLDSQDLTKSMVNNYIKQGIIPRPNGKRYTKEHIASLTVLMILKEVLPIQLCQDIFDNFTEKYSSEENYQKFLRALDLAMNTTGDHLEALKQEVSPDEQVLHLALLSYAFRRAAIQLLNKNQADPEDLPEKNTQNPD